MRIRPAPRRPADAVQSLLHFRGEQTTAAYSEKVDTPGGGKSPRDRVDCGEVKLSQGVVDRRGLDRPDHRGDLRDRVARRNARTNIDLPAGRLVPGQIGGQAEPKLAVAGIPQLPA